ncbi:MAG: hypothetical protein EXR95_03490 [Gemmatimonadetes bacterium]|nr:hypothetical protein [Gemmatimonadota bacterium]
MRHIGRGIAAILVTALAAPAAGRAQSLRGSVVDASTQLGVAGAAVRLIGADSQQVATAIAGDDGRFAVAAPVGTYTVVIERIGYTTTTFGPVRLRPSGFVEVNFALDPDPVQMDSLAVRVDEQDPTLRRAGFYQRMQDRHGLFLDRAYIEKRGSARMEDVLGGLTGVRVIHDGAGIDVQLRGSMTNVFRGTPSMCLPLVFVDGLLVADGKVSGFGRLNLESIRPQDVAGVELYMGESSVPLQFARGGACGALLFWTRSR